VKVDSFAPVKRHIAVRGPTVSTISASGRVYEHVFIT
jgi:hypothetical protein